MGKSQSKRSVDITTEGKKPAEEEEVTGKLEKIEDVDEQKQGNCDASPQKFSETELKAEEDDTENGKDLTTEKNSESQQQNEISEEKPMEESNESKVNVDKENSNDVEEISPLSDESIKKSKKEKVKKKWSFRSISFGKKDKQKPCKAEETSEDVVTNEEAVKPAVLECDATKESETVIKEKNHDKNIVASENNTNEDEKSTPTDNSEEVEANITGLAPKNDSIAISKQTIDNSAITAEFKGVVTSYLESSEENKNISEQSKLNILPLTDITIASRKVNDNLSCKLNDECYNGKHNENGTTEPQSQQIEVKTDKAYAECIIPDLIVPNNDTKPVNNCKGYNDNKNSGIICSDNLENGGNNVSHPPPLPCSPPPTHVSLFALTDNTKSETSAFEIFSKLMESANEKTTKPAKIEDEKTQELSNLKETQHNLKECNTKESFLNLKKEDKEHNSSQETITTSEIQLLENKFNSEIPGETQNSLYSSSCHRPKVDETSRLLLSKDIKSEIVNATSGEEPDFQHEELIATSLVQEICETAVVICGKDSSFDSSMINDKLDIFETQDNDIPIEENSLLKINDFSENEIEYSASSADCASIGLILSKDISKEDSMPEFSTQELSTASE